MRFWHKGVILMNRVQYDSYLFMNKQVFIDSLKSETDSLKLRSLYRESKTSESMLDFTSKCSKLLCLNLECFAPDKVIPSSKLL